MLTHILEGLSGITKLVLLNVYYPTFINSLVHNIKERKRHTQSEIDHRRKKHSRMLYTVPE